MNISTRSTVAALLLWEHPFERVVRTSTLAISCALIVLYAYLAGVSVLHAVAARSAENEIEGKRTELSRLEREYFTLASTVDMARGDELGLHIVKSKQFVARSARLGQLSSSHTAQ